jgi:hypothetical protein
MIVETENERLEMINQKKDFRDKSLTGEKN